MKKQLFYKLSTLGLVMTLLLMSNFASAQTKYAFKGIVKDAATGEGLVGATVNIGGTFQGCVADASGNYELSGAIKPGRYSLIFNYVAHVTHENFELTY